MANKPEKQIKCSPERHEHMKRIGAKKGETRNPAGRPPTPDELKISAAHMSQDALKAIEKLAKTSKNDMVRLKANELILSYNLSKAAQKVDVSGEVQHNFTSDLLAKAARARDFIEGQVIEQQALPASDKNPSL